MDKKIVLYHGSSKIIEKPIFGFGNTQNDYGLGFYCTESLDMACEWACSATSDGFANKYTLNTTDLNILSLTSGEYNILNWFYILLNNRLFQVNSDIALLAKEYIYSNFSIKYKSYDVIRGYRADDSYFSFANAFLNNTISIRQLEEAMVLGKLGEQVVLMSEKAFSKLTFNNASVANRKEYYSKKLARDTKARKDFAQMKNIKDISNEKYIADIIREGWKQGDERLQRIILK